MSFQRMLMMAAREPRPYLPHPEALVCLYVPRWQTEDDRAQLRDYSGNLWTMYLDGIVGWDSAGNITFGTPYGRARTELRQQSIYIPTATILANRTLTNTIAPQRGMYSFKGLREPWATGFSNYATELSLSNGVCEVGSGGVNTRVPWADLVQDGYIYMMRRNYCGRTIGTASDAGFRNYRFSINDGGAHGVTPPMWTTVRALAIWNIELNDEEIEQAKIYLSTATARQWWHDRGLI